MADNVLHEFLNKHGLTDPKWLKMFRKLKVTNPDCITNKDDLFERLSLSATVTETNILRKALGISNISSAVEKVDEILEEVGLESEYWASILIKEVGVFTVQGLNHMSDVFYPYLVQFARSPKEQELLQKLLKMEDNESTLLERYKQHNHKFEERKRESLLILEQLEKFKIENRSFEDEDVQVLNQRLFEIFLVPKAFWLQENSYKNIIDSVRNIYDDLTTVIEDCELQDDTFVVQHASNGLALKGILLQSGDKLHSKNNIINAPSEISLQAPFHSQHVRCIHCIGKADEERVLSISQNNMLSWSSAHSIPPVEMKDELTYCSSLKYFVVPVASFFFKSTQLQLSDEALESLEKINKITDDEETTQKECVSFLKDFGSHVCLGPFHFGGQYKWHCNTCNITKGELEEAKRLQTEVITITSQSTFLSQVFNQRVNSIKEIKHEFGSETLMQKTFIHVETTGVQQKNSAGKQNSVALWRNHLMADNSSWVVLDVGTEQVPVWEIIKKSHPQFSCQLAQNLQSAWKKQNSNHMSLTQDLYTGTDTQTPIKVNQIKDKTKCIENLNALIDMREKITKKHLDVFSWPMLYLTHRSVQEHIMFAINAYKKCSSSECNAIKTRLRQIIGPVDMEILGDLQFPNGDIVQKWVFETDDNPMKIDCNDLMLLVEHSLNPAQELLNEILIEFVTCPETTQRATSMVEKTICRIRRHFQITDQFYDDVFLVSFITPFNYDPEQEIFLQCLNISDISFLQEQLKTEIPKYFEVKKKSNCEIQAYLITLTINICKDLNVTRSIKFFAQLKLIDSLLTPMIDPVIKDILTDLMNNSVNLDSAVTSFKDISSATARKRAKDEILAMIKLEPGEMLDSCKRAADFRELLTMLNLGKRYPQNLSLQQAIEVRDWRDDINFENLQDGKHCSDPKLYPNLIIKKIMSFDHRCRLKLVHEVKHENSFHKHRRSNTDKETTATYELHPMDGLLTVLHCADNILRQDLLCRLSTCQNAIPLILPDPTTKKLTFLLWGMRTIIKQWMTEDKTPQEVPVISYKAPIISFMRLGTHRVSKSKVMNSVINNSCHNTFFHYDCDGGSIKSRFVDGLVEVGWYLPSSTNKAFEDVVVFVNMHGDARSFPTQLQFLREISFMSFVFLNERHLDEVGCQVVSMLTKSPGGCVLLRTETTSEVKMKYEHLILKVEETYSNCSVINLDKMNESALRDSI